MSFAENDRVIPRMRKIESRHSLLELDIFVTKRSSILFRSLISWFPNYTFLYGLMDAHVRDNPVSERQPSDKFAASAGETRTWHRVSDACCTNFSSESRVRTKERERKREKVWKRGLRKMQFIDTSILVDFPRVYAINNFVYVRIIYLLHRPK